MVIKRKRTRTLTAVIGLLTLGALVLGGREISADEDVNVTAALDGPSQVAFQRSDHLLGVARGPNSGWNANVRVASGTVPSQVALSGGVLAVGFQRNDGHFILDRFTNGTNTTTDTNSVLQAGTSPSLARCPTCAAFAFGFHGVNGNLWIGKNSNPLGAEDTHAPMRNGTGPSVAMASDGRVQLAFHGANGRLWVGQNGATSGVDSNAVMAAATSPSIAVGGPNNRVAIAFQGANGDLWFASTAFNGTDTGFPMKAGSSPSAAVKADGTAIVAFQSSNGLLFYLTSVSFSTPFVTNTGVRMNNAASPSVFATPAGGFQINCKADSGRLVIDVNGTPQDQLFVMN